MKNKYKINEILDAVNVILNHKDKMIEKKIYLQTGLLKIIDQLDL